MVLEVTTMRFGFSSPALRAPGGRGIYPLSLLMTRLLMTLLLATPLAAAEGATGEGVEGRVMSRGGIAIEHARVEVVEGGVELFTDARGTFRLECSLPCLLLVSHPRFDSEAVEVRTAGEPLAISLSPKQALFEEIDVTAGRSGDHFAPLSVTSTVIHPEDDPSAPSTLTEIVEGVAGVAENGQGGLFQVYSIRGISGHRVMTLIDGMPITSERRAGVSASFLDPLLIDSVDVLRGPSSTYYGSGALGGVVQIFPRRSSGFFLDTGYSGFGDERHLALGWGDHDEKGNGWSFALAHRTADDDEAADGTALNNEFQQTSAVLARDWQTGDKAWQLVVVPTYGHDIGKPNTDFPDRVTDYPRERHLLAKIGVTSSNGWSAHLFAHPNDLETEVLRVGDRLSTVVNESLELGGSFLKEWAGSSARSGVSGRIGVDYYARRGVSATETVEPLGGGPGTVTRSLDDASLDNLAGFGSVRWGWGSSTWQSGVRFTWEQQDNEGVQGAESRDDNAWTAFVGVVQPVGKGFELTANLGTGLRFPTLSERFFVGTTGRGQVIGNPGLDPEESVNVDAGLRWFGKKTFWSAQIFSQEVDDYIERITLDDGRRTFVNLSSGTIEGFELEGFYTVDEHWQLLWSGHWLEGESDDGLPLADIPSNRLRLGGVYRQGPWEGRLSLQYRADKDDPSSGEVPLEEAWLVDASLRWELNEGIALTLRGRNLLGEEYRNSADDKVTIAPGRSVGLSLSWAKP